jgi:sugar phosphate isomerase/epimerase
LKFRLMKSEPLRTLRDHLTYLEQNRFNVDVRLTDAEYNREVHPRELEKLAAELKERKISAFCHLPHHGLHLSCPDPRVMEYSREVIQEGLEIGTILGCRVAVLFSGFSNHVRPAHIPEWRERLVGSLRTLVTQAEEEEIILALENAYDPDATVLREVVDEIASPWLRFSADLGRAACFSRMAPEEWIHAFKERVIMISCHDNEGMEDDHLACGRGVVGYDQVFMAAQEADLSCVVNIDVAREDLDESIAHLESVGFIFERGEIPDSELFVEEAPTDGAAGASVPAPGESAAAEPGSLDKGAPGVTATGL